MPRDINDIERKANEIVSDIEENSKVYSDSERWETIEDTTSVTDRAKVSLGRVISYSPREGERAPAKDSVAMEYNNKRRESYLRQVNEGREEKVDSFEKLTDEEKEGFNSFDLSKEEKEASFKEAVERVKRITDARDIVINGDNKVDPNALDENDPKREEAEKKQKGLKGRFDEIKADVDKQIAEYEDLESKIGTARKEIEEIEESIRNATPEEVSGLQESLKNKQEELKGLEDKIKPFLEKKDGQDMTVIDRLKAVRDRMYKKDENNKDLLNRNGEKITLIGDVLSNNDQARWNAVKGLAEVYKDDDLVYGENSGIDGIAPHIGKSKKEFEAKRKEVAENLKNKPEQEVEKNDASGTDESTDGTASDQERDEEAEIQAGNNNGGLTGVAPFVAGAAGAAVANALNDKDEDKQLEGEDDLIVDDGIEQAQLANARNAQQEQPLSYIQMLGYDPSKKLNFNRAENVLNNFLSDENKANQIAILKDPEASKVVFDSMRKVNRNINPFKCAKVYELRDRLINNGDLREQITKIYADENGVPNYEDLKNEYKEGKGIIDSEIEKIKADKGEDSPEYLEALDKKESLNAVINYDNAIDNNLMRGSLLQDFYNGGRDSAKAKISGEQNINENVANSISSVDPDALAKNIEDKQKENELADLRNQTVDVYSKSDEELKKMIEEDHDKSMDSLVADIDAQEQAEKKAEGRD